MLRAFLTTAEFASKAGGGNDVIRHLFVNVDIRTATIHSRLHPVPWHRNKPVLTIPSTERLLSLGVEHL
jgi:hypothetical protein